MVNASPMTAAFRPGGLMWRASCRDSRGGQRPDRASRLGKRALDQFGNQEALRVHRARQLELPGRHALEAETAVIGLVADEEHQAVAFAPGGVEGFAHERRADAASLEGRLDG